MLRKIFVMGLAVAAMSSCVSLKKYNSLKADAIRLDSENATANENIEKLRENVSDLEAQITGLRNDIAEEQAKYKKLLADGSAEADRMLRELEENQSRLSDLEAKLKNREEAIRQIRRKVTDALLGFDGKGLTITQKNGNVYVSMEDKLLFRSGSFSIDPEGEKAVVELAKVLAQNPDINVMVEGHTDNVPYKKNGQLDDNLDLSVKRATTVTRLLLKNTGIAPERITSAGRGDALPLDKSDTREARQKNRRTEIILTPKLDELLQLMETK